MKTTTSNPPNREVANRHLILKTAIQLGEEHGWNKLTVRKLASELKYTPPVLYQFFKNKEDLLKAIVAHGFDELKTALEKALNSRSAPADKLLEFAKARYRFATDHKALHAIMFSPGAPDWHRDMLSKNIQSTHKTVHGLLQTLSGRSDSCNDLVLNFISLIKGYTFFTNEIVPTKHKKEIIGDLKLNTEFEEAMIRFIKSIQPDE